MKQVGERANTLLSPLMKLSALFLSSNTQKDTTMATQKVQMPAEKELDLQLLWSCSHASSTLKIQSDGNYRRLLGTTVAICNSVVPQC